MSAESTNPDSTTPEHASLESAPPESVSPGASVSAGDAQVHRRLAAELFNRVWALLEQPARTQAEDDTMLHAAHWPVPHPRSSTRWPVTSGSSDLKAVCSKAFVQPSPKRGSRE